MRRGVYIVRSKSVEGILNAADESSLSLNQMKCAACRKGEPTVTNAEVTELHPQVPDWRIVEADNIKMLERVFKFENFSEALNFTNKVGEIAEAEGHHPSITTDWGKVAVRWWTHKIKGLHRNDFIMAAKTDQLYKP